MKVSKKAALLLVLLCAVNGTGFAAYADETKDDSHISENVIAEMNTSEPAVTEIGSSEETSSVFQNKELDLSRYYQGDKISLAPDYGLPDGGKNKIGHELYRTRNDSIMAEAELRKKGYVLISTEAKEISDDDLEILANSKFWFSEYLERSSKNMSWVMDKIYIYKPLLNNYLAEYREDGIVSRNTSYQVMTKTVMFAYSVYYFNDRVGTISDMFNENIPEYLVGAYMEINSPINVEVTLINWGMKCYFKFYISKGTPFMVKLPEGQYKVAGINTVDIGKMEPAMPLHNMVYLTRTEYGDRDHPYVMDITPVINKYVIPEADISGMPDLSLDQNQNIPEERTVVDTEALEAARKLAQEEIDRENEEEAEKKKGEPTEEEIEKEKKKERLKAAGFITVIGLALFTIISKFIKLKEKKRKGGDDGGDKREEDDSGEEETE